MMRSGVFSSDFPRWIVEAQNALRLARAALAIKGKDSKTAASTRAKAGMDEPSPRSENALDPQACAAPWFDRGDATLFIAPHGNVGGQANLAVTAKREPNHICKSLNMIRESLPGTVIS